MKIACTVRNGQGACERPALPYNFASNNLEEVGERSQEVVNKLQSLEDLPPVGSTDFPLSNLQRRKMNTTETQEELDIEFRRRWLMDQFAQIDEQTRAERVERNLEVDRQRVIGSHHFAKASTECIYLYTHGFFIATVMITQAVNEGIIKFVAERNNIQYENMTVSDILQTLESQGIISQDCSKASEEIRRSFRNDVHHMNPPVAEINFPELAKKNIHNLAAIEREIWATNFRYAEMIPSQPQYWDVNPDGSIPVNLRGGF